MLDWAGASGWPVHVLLTKADKLNQSDRAAALKDAKERLGRRHDRAGVFGHGQDRGAGGAEALRSCCQSDGRFFLIS